MRLPTLWLIAARRLLVWLALAGVLLPSEARAQGTSAAPGAELDVYLLTMGQGDLVWEKFGHNAIWIHDPVRGTDLAYNYGMFDFNQPGFLPRFLKGRWIYWMEGFDAYQTLEHYRSSGRTVHAQELNLTPAQKLELQRFLEWNARPENRFYEYDYYKDNCSTRVRDALDRVLGGRIRAATAAVPTGTTYRWHSERLIADDRASYTGLLVGLGPAADRPLSVWEEMFVPMLLQTHLREITVPDATGRPVPLVKSERTLVPAARAPERATPPNWLAAYGLAGLALGASFVLLARLAPGSGAARFGWAALVGLWSLLAGTGGLILLGLLFTDHSIAHRNENLLQLSPFLLPLVLLAPALAYGARWAGRVGVGLAVAAAGLSLLGWILQLLPGLDQVNAEVIAVALPANLGLAWGVLRLRRTLAGGTEVDAPPRRGVTDARAGVPAR